MVIDDIPPRTCAITSLPWSPQINAVTIGERITSRVESARITAPGATERTSVATTSLNARAFSCTWLRKSTWE